MNCLVWWVATLVCVRGASKFSQEPRPCVLPVSLHHPLGHVHGLGNLLDGQTGKEPQADNARCSLVGRF